MNGTTRRRLLLATGGAVLTAPAIAQSGGELKIGGIGSLSGGGTAWGLALQRGVTLLVDEINAQGGLKVGSRTHRLRFVMLDDQYTAAGGRTAAERLINLEKVHFVIGPIGSPAVLGAISATTPAKVICLHQGFASAILKNDAGAPYNFRIICSTVEFGPAMVDWLHTNLPQVKKVALVAPNDATGQFVVPTLASAYKAKGMDTWTEMFDRGLQEFTPLLTRMMAQGVDLLDLNSNSPGDSVLLVKQARQIGFRGTIWQVGGPAVEEIRVNAGPLAEGFMSWEVFDFTSPAGQAFATAYRARWPGIVNAHAPVWYNAAEMLFEAIRRAGTASDTDQVRAALEGLDSYETKLFGRVAWGGMANYGVRHQLALPFWIAEIKGGEAGIRTMIRPAVP